MDEDPLVRLQQWYADQCDGDWEHQEGIEIRTLDNPGWSLRISLVGTGLERRTFKRIRVERTEADWLRAWLENDTWNAACGAPNLAEAVEAFLTWASP